MKVSLLQKPGNRLVECTSEADVSYVVAPERCPVCAGMGVLIAHDIKHTAIFSAIHAHAAMTDLRAQGARAPEELPDPGEFRVRAERIISKEEYTTVAEAKCDRCRSYVGELTVELGTIFGRTEDALVLDDPRRMLRVY